MLEVDERLTALLDEARNKTGKKLVLIPRSNLAVRASILNLGRRKVAIQYSPDKCDVGDLAYELLAVIQESDEEWRRATTVKIVEDEVSSLIEALVRTPWILLQLRRRGLASKGIMKDNFEVNLEYLKSETPPYSHLENPKVRTAFSAVSYAMYLITRSEVNYGEKSVTYELLYKMKDPEAMELGEKAAGIVEKNKCLTPREAQEALKKLLTLLKLEKAGTETNK